MFWMAGLEANAENYFSYIIILFAVLITGVSFIEICTFFAPTNEAAAAIGGMLTMFQIVFCGFFIPRESIKDGWIWMYYWSYLRYGLAGLIHSEFSTIDGIDQRNAEEWNTGTVLGVLIPLWLFYKLVGWFL